MSSIIRTGGSNIDRSAELRGLSTDTKPTRANGNEVPHGSTWYNMDDSTKYMYNADNDTWYNIPNGGGGGTGDMQKSVYDPTNTVANAGGIDTYVETEIGDAKEEVINEVNGNIAVTANNLIKDTVGWNNKNLLPITLSSLQEINTNGTWDDNVYTYRNITITVETDIYNLITDIKVNGANTAGSVAFKLTNNFVYQLLSEDKYYISDGVDVTAIVDGSAYISVERKKGESGESHYLSTNNENRSTKFTVDYATYDYYSVSIYIPNNSSINNAVFYPMIRRVSISDATYEPYRSTVEDELNSIDSAIGTLNANLGIANSRITNLQNNKANISDLGTSAYKNSTSVVTDSSDLVESGAVKDIVGWGNKNLLDPSIISTSLRYVPIYVGSGQFTCSSDAPLNGNGGANLFLLAGNVSDGASTAANGVYINVSRTVESVDGYVTIVSRCTDGVNVRNYNNQLEKGSTVTTYEPYHASVEEMFDDLGTSAYKNSTSVVTDSSDLVESGAVYDAIQELSDSNATAIFTKEGNPIVIDNAVEKNAESLKVDLEPIQSGSGTPSPDNIRAISGRTETSVVTRNEDNTDSHTVTLQFGETVYGGEVDFNTGKVRVKKKSVKGNTITWIDNTVEGNQRFRSNGVIRDAKAPSSSIGINTPICSKFPTNNNAIINTREDGICLYTNGYIYVESITTTSLSDFQALIADADICYELATPYTIQLTPAQLRLLKGYNYVTADGDITISYHGEIKQWVEDEISDVVATKADNSVIAPVENGTTASQAYAVGSHFIRNGAFCTVTTAISSGESLVGSNKFTSGDVADELTVKMLAGASAILSGVTIDSGRNNIYKYGKLVFVDIKITVDSDITVAGSQKLIKLPTNAKAITTLIVTNAISPYAYQTDFAIYLNPLTESDMVYINSTVLKAGDYIISGFFLEN